MDHGDGREGGEPSLPLKHSSNPSFSFWRSVIIFSHSKLPPSPTTITPLSLPMAKLWFWALLYYSFHTLPSDATFIGAGVGVGVGVGVNGGGPDRGATVWFSGGFGAGNPFPSPDTTSSSLSRAYRALQAWKSAITNDPTGLLSSWVGTNVCAYKGVFCSQASDTSSDIVVSAIDLNHADLQGVLVKDLSLLSELSVFHVNSNRFSGAVPDSFRALLALSELDLSNNQLSGPFPDVVLELPSLIYLDLRFNQFSGPIPDHLFNVNLDAIFLNNNQFDGQIPESLGNSPASVMNFANNKFSGDLPPSFGYMGPRLKEVLFVNNQLTGCIPEGVGMLEQIEVLDLSLNSFTGHLPDTLSCLSEIEVLNLAHNQFSGIVPDFVCNSLKSLLNLTIAYNFFSGFGPECTTGYKSFGFDFSGNCIPGKYLQRPAPECLSAPGGFNCMRIPSTTPVVCGSRD